ncbi:MAG: CotH kinase family protein [Lachnospiraceae bacterium]|nr:CotH kinase family protein [Lachnospiraceae bacterium]
MIAHKHITKIIAVIMVIAVILCLLAVGFADKLSGLLGGEGVTMEYETKLFDTDEIISVDIKMDEEEWSNMLQNAISEEYYVCDVEINGTKISNVAIRPKGNTSLSSIAMDPDTDRISMKLEFDHFVEGQTCFGLDKLILNNNYADATNMKEALIYDMYQFLGAEASLYNYAEVSINGEYWGIYLALEGVEQSFMLRNFGTQDGELYKPESMEMGGDGGPSGSGGPSKPDMDFGDFEGKEMPEGFGGGDFEGMEPPEGFGGGPGSGGFPGGDFDPENMPDMGNFNPGERPEGEDGAPGERPEMPGGRSSSGSGGADLNYTDDELDSYQTIWDGEITGTSDADHRRVVTALKNVSEGNDIEKYIDVDNVLKYMAVHTFAVNMDSLSGSMAHNYYLYEYDGQLNFFPWDYNLSFGGMSRGKDADATETINDAIDTPFSGTDFFDALLSNEEYLERYHEYLRQLVDEYVEGGRLEETYSRIRSQIDGLVETDPTAFYSYDEYLNAADILIKTIKLRAQSVKGQLEGTIPSTDEGRKVDSSTLIDGSGIDIKAMGQMNMGGNEQ